MALFDEQLNQLEAMLAGWRGTDSVRELPVGERPGWPLGSSLVLEEDTALELGNPALASASLLLWGGSSGGEGDRVTLVGPDIAEARERSLPFAQVVVVEGTFPDEYDSYRDIRDAVLDTKLEGFSVRTMPSKWTIWCRVAKEAAENGFSLADLGSALVRALRDVKGVTGVQVLFVTSEAADVRRLAPVAAGARRVVDAMMRMYQEENFDCETCEYQDVCETVNELKMIKTKLVGER